VGWDWVHLERRPLIGLLYQPRMIDDECGAVGGMRIGRGNRSTRRKPTPLPLCRPPKLHHVTWTRTRAAVAAGSRRLTAWSMTRPYREPCALTAQDTIIFGILSHLQMWSDNVLTSRPSPDERWQLLSYWTFLEVKEYRLSRSSHLSQKVNVFSSNCLHHLKHTRMCWCWYWYVTLATVFLYVARGLTLGLWAKTHSF
jgi:hypothetical protein